MKRLLMIIASLCLIMVSPTKVLGESESSEEELKLYAQSAVLIDGESGRVLYGKNEELQRPMASTTKIMTCILALENGNLEDKVEISAYAARQPKVHLGLKAKEEIYLKDLLYSLMLESHNDSAVAIAEHIGGSVEGFAELMNQKARDLGCQDTYFITPNGLDATITNEDGTELVHSTTAADLARIMKYCVSESPKQKEFLQITQTQNYTFTNLAGKRSYSCTNHNAFLTMMPGVLSGKTGFTGGAGYSYIVALEDDGRIFIAALLGCGWPPHKTYKWSDTKDLLNYGKNHYQYQEVFEQKEFPQIPIINGIPASEDLQEPVYMGLSFEAPVEEQTLQVLLKENEQVQVDYRLPNQLQAPIGQGEAVGEAVYSLNGDIIETFPIVTNDTIGKVEFGWCLQKVLQLFYI